MTKPKEEAPRGTGKKATPPNRDAAAGKSGTQDLWPQNAGDLYQATAQALGNAAHNAVAAQQQTNTIAQAATTQGVALLYSLDTAGTGGDASEKILPD